MNQYQNYTYYQNQQEEPTPVLLPQNPPKARLHTGIIGFAIVLGLLLTLFAQLIILGVVEVMYPSFAENDWYMWVFSSVPLYLVGMPVA